MPRVYPRVCGGTRTGGQTYHSGPGLSPRVRGNPYDTEAEVGALGSIPACAGEPLATGQRGGRCPVYPRVCGGTLIGPSTQGSPKGLSPRVRGNPALSGHHTARRSVYPRVCGGTRFACSSAASISGLSPRVRGNRSAVASRIRRAGSIPACAGEPLLVGIAVVVKAVYPRVCGGTARPHRQSRPDPVYPRVCGGTNINHLSIAISAGLSPRVRGNQSRIQLCVSCPRSIPACAGEP